MPQALNLCRMYRRFGLANFVLAPRFESGGTNSIRGAAGSGFALTVDLCFGAVVWVRADARLAAAARTWHGKQKSKAKAIFQVATNPVELIAELPAGK